MDSRAYIHAAIHGEHPRLGMGPVWVIYGLILLSAVVVTLDSMVWTSPAINAALGWAERILLAFFVLEFLARLICAPRPLRYLFSFWGIVDFLATIPALLLLSPSLQSVRVMRLLRLIRLLKLLRIGKALDRIEHAFWNIRDELFAVLAIAGLAIFLSAVGIYHFENEAQPDVFSSIPAALWWAVATMTTVGYGDIYPITTGGRVFTGLVLLIGIALVALPAGLLTAALMDKGVDTGDTGDKKPDI